jgi:Rrf2 family protein
MLRMRKTTCYALYAAIELARARGKTVTAAEVARRHGVPATVVAKVFQQLAHAGIAQGIRGSHGGYRLVRRASETTMLEVIDALEPARAGAGGRFPAEDAERRLRDLLDEAERIWRSTFRAMSLDTLAELGPHPIVQP